MLKALQGVWNHKRKKKRKGKNAGKINKKKEKNNGLLG
jgi:hypothetical protein